MITLIIGPMFSGKSTHLLMQEQKTLIANKNVLFFKHSIDNRYTETGQITTHDGANSKSKTIITSSLLRYIENQDVQNAHVILIDEGQFFNDLVEFCELMGSKNIYISALSSDFQMKMFQPIIDILGKSDRVIHQTAICRSCGEDAPYSYRKVANKSQTLIGGSDIYEPRCRKCFL